jgi:transcriptional regulator with XRE-family HTH domain
MKNKPINKRVIERKTAIWLKIIGQRFYDLRKARKESIRTTAVAIKMSPAIISKIEKGKYGNFRLLRLIRLCEYYDVNPKDIVHTKPIK